MTQEEKLEEAKRLYKTANADQKYVLESLFPELKESEDERIRNFLISKMKEVGNVWKEYSAKDIIAWLEKQGEHANFRNKIQIGDKVTRNQDGVLVNLSQLKRVAKKDEKQGEQKPILDFKAKDWYVSKVDGKIHNICHSIDKMVDDYANNKERGNEEFGKPVPCMIRAYRQGLNDAIEKVILKRTWSEEDENKLSDAIFFVREYQIPTRDKKLLESAKKAEDWLKSLKDRVQPQNKWKESLVTADLENSLCDIQDAFSDTSYEYRILGEAIEFIRCTESKPQWKPSDEQMKGIECTIKTLKYQLNVGDNRLNSLYNDLKKLREE